MTIEIHKEFNFIYLIKCIINQQTPSLRQYFLFPFDSIHHTKMSAKNQLKLIFIPFPVLSHLVSAVETAKLIADRNERLSITVIVMKLPTDTKIDSYTKNSQNLRINFVVLHQNQSIVSELIATNPKTFVFRFVESQRDPVRDAVAKIVENSEHSRIVGFVVDMFCTPMIDVANGFKIPSYVFFPSGSAALGLFFHLQSLRDDHGRDVTKIVDSDRELSVPSFVNRVPGRVLPSSLVDRGNDFLDIVKRFREAKGIVINTFLEFEPHAIRSLTNDEKIPPVYPIGPIIQANNGVEEETDWRKHNEIVLWLDEQPDSSVVFLCFGSNGSFEGNQVKEIAVALEHSGYRFLWSLRKPPPEERKMEFPGEYEDFDEVLPEGFLQRTAETGKVIGWAPQMAVLSHPAVGGFVSHCGWNSTLESVWCGVPMAVWPLAAEQQANAFQLVKELGIAVEMKMDYRKNCGVVVEAERIEKGIRELMDMENAIRSKVKVLKEESRRAVLDGGSSFDFLDGFIETVMNSNVF